MNKILVRPSLLLLILIYFATLISGYIKTGNIFFIIIITVSTALLFFTWKNIDKKSGLILLCFSLFFIFFARSSLFFHIKPDNHVANVKSKILYLEGMVNSGIILKRTSKRKVLHQEFSLKIKKAYTKRYAFRVRGKALVKNSSILKNLKPGSKIIVGGWIKNTGKMRPLGNFNYGRYLWRNGFSHFVWVKKNKAKILDQKSSNNLIYLPNITKNFLVKFVFSKIKHEKDVASFINALLLGQRNDLKDEIKEDFRKAGVYHVLALSGLHMGMIFVFVFGIFAFLGTKRKTAFLFTGLALIIFTIIAGLKYSLIRALLMALFIVIIKIAQRDKDYLNSLFLAGFFIILFDPSSIFSVSFQLSFGATLGIILFFKPVNNYLTGFKLIKKQPLLFISGAVAVTISAQILILPLLLHYFGIFYFISFLANILVVPLVSFIAFTAILGFLTFFIPLISSAFFSLSELITNSLFWIVKFFSSLSFLSVKWKIPVSAILLYYLLFAMLYFTVKYKKKIKDFMVFINSQKNNDNN